jgi:hypothetical protein
MQSDNARPLPHCISDYRPTQGAHCFNCHRMLPRVPNASLEDEARIQALIVECRFMDASRYLQDRLHVSYRDSKIAIMHMHSGWRRPVGPACEKCGSYLRTPKARFCVNCGHRREIQNVGG